MRYWQFSTSAPSELSEWLVQDLANSVLIKLRQSAECESSIEASRLGILKINPDIYWLSNLCRCCFDVIGSAEPHRYFIDCFVCSLLNIKLVFRYQINFFCIPLLFSVCSKVVNLIHLFNHSL